ncbi:MAG: hypothetical protein RSE12_03640 [Fuscovulum sp.]|nr:MAG: hypothetical protein RSE12_03640 [Fuscovulum sp.]
MVPALVETLFFIGFFALWLGFVLIFISIAIPVFSHPAYWKTLFAPFYERSRIGVEVINHAFQTAGKSRLNRVGQALGAIGISLLILTFLLWFALRIAQGPTA